MIILLIATFNNVQAQDVIPSSADIRLVQGTAGDQLLVQMKIHSTSDFGGILSALTVTIRYDASSGMAIGGGTSFCSAWSAFSPSPVVLNGGLAYRTYNGFGINRLEDPVFDGGCGISLVPEEWFTITTIPVAGEGCTEFILGNDAFTQLSNRNYYVSMGGHNVTGQVLDGPVNGGNCAPDCLGIPGGTALPGTPCDDLDPGTFDDTWGANCVCTGTTGCVPPTITGTSTNSPICSSNGLNLAVTATGSGPLSYAWTGAGSYSPNPTSASVTVTGAATGPYQVTVSNTCGDASASIPVMVQQAPSATIAYGGSPYCATTGTATVTRTGTSGGTYTASPGGLSITGSTGTINLGNSTAGTYTVTYTIAAGGGCAAFSTTATVVITAGPSATISYTGTPFCGTTGTASVTRTGSGGGTYIASPSGLSINGNNGTINLGNSTAGTYTVTYTIAAGGGCAAFSTTATVVITAGPSATISYTGTPFCGTTGTASVTRTGSGGGTYIASPSGLSINGNNGTINLGNSTAGTYTVTYTIAAGGGCAAFSTTATVVITAGPSATISYAGTPFCGTTGTATVTRTGTSGGTYTASPNGLSLNGNNGTINLGSSASGTYTVAYTIAAGGGCSAFSTTAAVVINAPVTWYADVDNDGVGDDASTVQACIPPAGYVSVGGDLCPQDPDKLSPGICGCGIPDTDTDNDGAADCVDGCPTDPDKIAPGVCGCGIPDIDSDKDGLADCIDSCPTLVGEIGGPCDDGDPTTVNDIITPECICAGTITIGITETEQAHGVTVSLYPNPHFSGMVHVDIDGLTGGNGDVLIEVHDASGRLVHQASVAPVGGKAHFAMDLKDVGRGLYMVEVITEGHRYLKRLVMQ
ncbi:MAG TPA: T9SS type A sorting domain-containing protein [Flavobacteriales bacterium]|nr:T9SS type A sorting domain-containing protein [Flavobacteriales bacterium]HQY81060.1 T9SS type A sorting domain-containing protein [Flavobacteriales bacterium]